MKPSLQLKLSQHLALTPQLQQSIKLLQLSTLEHEQELEKYLQENNLPLDFAAGHIASGDLVEVLADWRKTFEGTWIGTRYEMNCGNAGLSKYRPRS